MSVIGTTSLATPVSRIDAPAPIAAGLAPTRPPPMFSAADDASSLPAAASLRVRLARTHDESVRLQRVTAFADAADAALGETQELLDRAHGQIGAGSPVDDTLASIDAATARPLAQGAPFLHDGITLDSGIGSFDVRPVSASDLGAVIDGGRSHRLIDLRTGGSLDSRAHPGAALRSADAARGEVAAVRASLGEFRASSLVPAQRGTVADFRAGADAGTLGAAEADGAARDIRNALARSASGALTGSRAESVLHLLQ